MNRLTFFKRLGIGTITTTVAPSVFIKQDNTEFITTESLKEEFNGQIKKTIPWRNERFKDGGFTGSFMMT